MNAYELEKYDVDGLTKRENEVVYLASLGLTNKEISEKLCLHKKTIEGNLVRIYFKFDVKNRVQLAVRYTLGLIK